MTRSSGRSRRLVLLAALVFFAPLLLELGSVQAQSDPVAPSVAAQGSELWSATMRVGINTRLVGYSSVPERTAGALTNDVFSWRGTDYTVTNIAYNRSRGGADGWNVLIDFSPALPEGFECLTLRLGDHWLNLADARGNSRQFFWYGLELDWRIGGTVPVELREFPAGFEARSIDGRGNNRNRPELGMAGTQLLRQVPVSYGYALSGDPPPDLPDGRFISNIVSAQSEPVPGAAQVTDMVWQWGQFLDHDISLTPEGSPRESLPIPVPRGDAAFDPFRTGQRTIAFNRSAFDPSTGTGADNPREQVTVITAFIDASNVYGSEGSRTRALRTNDGTGKLRTSDGGRFLPYNEDGISNDGGNRRRAQDLFLAGDIRANEQVGLTSLHTLFVREHNRLADVIAAENPDLNGNEIFELARKIVGAQMQVVTYNEFLPLLLGPGAIGPYEGYDSEVDPTISNEFATAAYRFGHTMLSPSLLQIDSASAEREVSLAQAFFNPSLVAREGISSFLRGLAGQQAQEVDLLLVDEVRNLLFGAPGGPGRDLAALNIQRGRDHGLPDYNTARRASGLPPAGTFADVSSDPDTQDALSRAYGDVQYLDLWTGSLAEDHVPGAMIGETPRTVIAEQFRRLRDGDRYWYENDPYFLANPSLLADVRTTTLADIIRRNTSIGNELPDNVFGGPPPAILIAAATSPVEEGAEARFTLARSGSLARELSVNVRIAETGAMLRDALAAAVEVTFGVGEETTALTLATDRDAVIEDDSAITATVAEDDGYQVDATGNSASVTVQDNDSEEIALESGWTSFEWPGLDGVPVAEALQGAGQGNDISDRVVAVYRWDEPTRRWLAFFPDQEASGANTLTAFEHGHTYWIATTEPVTWTVFLGAIAP